LDSAWLPTSLTSIDAQPPVSQEGWGFKEIIDGIRATVGYRGGHALQDGVGLWAGRGIDETGDSTKATFEG
jgi:hypothetical protein